MNKDEMRQVVQDVRSKLRVTKVTCTRSVKGRGGDVFVGFTAAWDSVQDDNGHVEDSESKASGMTLKEAKVAAHLLGLQTDVVAFEHALASSVIRPHQAEAAIKGVRQNYTVLMSTLLKDEESGNGE